MRSSAFYYKTVAGRELDVIFEADGLVHAIKIKCTRAPSRADTAALRDFAARCSPTAALGRPVLPVLFTLVDTPAEQDGVRILPVATLMGAG